MRGDATLFMRADQVEAAWEILTPVIDTWNANPSVKLFSNYAAGMQGLRMQKPLLQEMAKAG